MWRRSRGVSFDVPSGQLFGLLGPNGAGKTTTIKILTTLLLPTGGSARVLGLDPARDHRELRRRIGYVFGGDKGLYERISALENLRYFAAILGVPRDDVERAIAQVGLQGRERDLVARLSGGQRARVSLAAALLGTPELLVLDEPTVGLDPVLRTELWDLFHRLAADGATLLISSHVMDEATRCGHLLLMRDGAVIADDTPEALLARTGATQIEAAFLALVAQQEPDSAPSAPSMTSGQSESVKGASR